MGNGRVGALLVEAVWRFLRWQPGWKAAQRMKVMQLAGASLTRGLEGAESPVAAVIQARQIGRCVPAHLSG